MTALKPAKHGRDHCPGSEDPIPCLRPNPFSMIEWYPENSGDYFAATSGVQYEFPELTVAGGGTMDFTWGINSASATGVFLPDLTTGIVTFLFGTGFVVGQAIVRWESAFTGNATTWVALLSADTPSGDTGFLPHIDPGTPEVSHASMLQMYVGGESAFGTGYFQQDSGSAKNLIYASFSIFLVDTGVRATTFP